MFLFIYYGLQYFFEQYSWRTERQLDEFEAEFGGILAAENSRIAKVFNSLLQRILLTWSVAAG